MRVNGHWVYLHRTPDGMVYVGRSNYKYTCQRWRPLLYKHNSLWEYIEKYGWDNIQHELVKDGMTKEESFELEDELIRKYKAEGICINKQCSGGLQCDGEYREYQRQYRETHREYFRQYYQSHREEILEYKRQHYINHRDEIIDKRRARRAAKKQQKSPKSPSDGIAKKSQQPEYQYGDPLF